MKKHALILMKDGQESVHPLQENKTILGRDKSCDVVLDDVAVSRKHAAVVFRFEKVYIENISPSAQIHKGGQAFEYAEVLENEEVNIGPYILVWRRLNASEFASDKKPEDDVNSEENGDLHAEQVFDSPLTPEQLPVDNNAAFDPAFNVGNDLVPFDVEAVSGAPMSSEDNFALVSASESTQVSIHQAVPKLKITKGENVGREIKLDAGTAWVVGRSRKAHIFIDSQKLSRQHFKIIKIKDKFRIQDMGSSSGTRLNGVAVDDAPLQAFDSIQAGNVEFHFLMVDAQYNQELPQNALQIAPNPTSHQTNFENSSNSTLINIPVPYSQTNSSQSTKHSIEEPLDEDELQEEEINEGQQSLLLKLRRQQKKLKKQWDKLPPKKKKLYAGVAAAIVLMLALSTGEQEGQKDNQAQNTSAVLEDVTINVAQSPDISPTYYALSVDKQNLIRKLYADAERAESQGRWQEALDNTSKILDYVDKYKKTKDIMLNAQSQINESYFKNSSSISDAQNAERRNQEQIKVFMETGNSALQERRWKDAEDAYVSVLTLDPTHEEAQQKLLAARNKDPNGHYALHQEPVIEVDPEQEAKEIEIEMIQSLKTQYQVAADYVRGPEFRKSIPILKDLDNKISNLQLEYRQGRAPASIRDELVLNAQKLQSLVEEAYDQALSQLDIEYQTQLADAGQYTANRQYVQARQQYDQILAREPLYEKVRLSRQRLYERMISEAKNLYRGAVIYESVGDLRSAVTGLQKTKELLENVQDYEAVEYYMKAESRLSYLKR